MAQATAEKDLGAIGWVLLAMTAVIIIYDQLMFRPLVAWADKFRFEQTAARERPQSWVYDLWRRARLVRRTAQLMGWVVRLVERLTLPGDRRAWKVRLTAKGRAVFEEMAAEHETWIVDWVDSLSIQEQQQLHALLGKLKQSVREKV